ncbi:MAG: hypothetical protein KIS92_25180 [Planctomycetota bacterium]|nr:hypothetical protein [Planctomycetota bacterium]
MVVYEAEFEITPSTSERLLDSISEADAQKLLADPELQAESKRTGIDLAMLLSNWRLAPEERWRENHRQALALTRWDREAEHAGLKL